MKKFITTTVLTCTLLSTAIPTFASTSNETSALNEGPLRAYVHTSSRHIAKDGSYGYTTAETFDGSKIHYLKAIMSATYSNGQVSGGTSSNSETSNKSYVNSGTVWENGPKRQYHSSSEAKNTLFSSKEYLSGKSEIFN